MIGSEPAVAGSSRLRLRRLLAEQLQQGLSPHQLALALALGGTLGCMPLLWGTSLLCVLLALRLRLNLALVQLINYLFYPLQILLFIPYLKGGRSLFGADRLPDDLQQFAVLVKSDPLLLFGQFWIANLQGLVLWLVTAPFWFGGIYLLVSRVCQWGWRSDDQQCC